MPPKFPPKPPCETGVLYPASPPRAYKPLPSLLDSVPRLAPPSNGMFYGTATAADKERAANGCYTCIYYPLPGERCPQENLGLSPTWRTREHGVGCPRRKTKTEEDTQ